ncbi:GSCFA domain-containing protein [Paracoccus sp. Z330]|uniref:GSCFA domain-containing protein n=1 Tax=Paracoccus onchidii TaxID=3017813 RepID=A0ABT4ZCI7_9RHOB|nr:GSCFA domain-containing protein [Paracoccus onchidii]MDB6176678.1 GSCFA domain-containing protein [Paracoccus onchidii]
MAHPYSDLPSSAFWRHGVADAAADQLQDIHCPAFRLDEADCIATAGSCFAQHLGRALRDAGLTVLDGEPAPKGIAPDLAHRYGFGLYSGRYGNIYTARQMVQFLDEVAAGQPDPAHVWQRDGRYFDALRPGLEPNGLDSAQEVLAMRSSHLARVGATLRQADVFVFTLGLTEAWRCRATGRVYPTCPGVIAGSYDPELHEFVNFSYPQVQQDLIRLLERLQDFKAGMRLLLTVSPVPLTATASDSHVLPATQYSKATLRAAAGDMASAHEQVDYFPSYEIVTNPAARGRFYADDLRRVTDAGVATVMKAFLAAHGLNPADGRVRQVRTIADPVCEDAMLEAFGR